MNWQERYSRRGAAVVAFVIALLVMMLILVGMVLGGARDQDMTLQRLDTLRAYYAAEGGLNVAICEVMHNTDADGDGGIGSISNDGNNANDPLIGVARTHVISSAISPDLVNLTSIGNTGIATRDISMSLTPVQGQFGFGIPFANEQQGIPFLQIATKVNFPQNAVILSLSAYLNGPSPKQARFAVYSDSGGEPNLRLTQSYSAAVGGDSAHFHWFTLFVPSTTVTPNDYWLALGFENMSMEYAFDTMGGQMRYNTNDPVANGFNNPWGVSSGASTRRINLYATAATETTGRISIVPNTVYDNTNPPLSGLFRDVTSANAINCGNDISGNASHYSAINFEAPSGTTSDCFTAYDITPAVVDQTNFTKSLRVSADVLVIGTANSRWIGLAALHNEGTSQGLAIILQDNGNSDQLLLYRMPFNGDISGASAIASSGNFNTITQNNWYRLVMDVTIARDNLQIDARVYSHVTPGDPTSLVNDTPLKSLTYSGTVSGLAGLQTAGEVGVCFDATNASSKGCLTNFEIDSAIGTTCTSEVSSWSEVKPY